MSKSLYLIDTQLSDYQSIIDSLSFTDTYYLIDANSDGLTQIASILSAYKDLDALHIFSQGAIGSLNLGNTVLNQENIALFQPLLQSIGSSLTVNGDILLYGYQPDTTEAFINSLLVYTDADVAALTMDVQVGEWVVTASSGIVETLPIGYVISSVVNTAPIVSAPITLNSVAEDSGSIFITQAKLLANSSDIDGDTLSVDNLTASSGTLINNYNGTWSLTPAANYNGTISLNYDVSDGTTFVAATATQEVAAVNDAPTLFMGNNISDVAKSVTVQADGKILVAGYSGNGPQYDFTLVRYNTDGSLDTTFSNNGMVKTDVGTSYDYGSSVTVQTDGKILVAGSSRNAAGNDDFALVRYNSDGSLDTTFSGDGIVTTAISTGYDNANSITVQPDGKILLAGSSGVNTDFALVRYNRDGSLDKTFSGDGIVTTAIGTGYDSALSVTVQTDGKILAAGYSNNGTNNDFALIRYNSDGSLDTTFSGDGKVTTDFTANYDAGRSVTVQSDGKILVAGYNKNGSNDDFALVRYNSDGSLDTTFNGDGKVTTAIGVGADGGYSVTVQPDGKILVAGVSKNGSNDDFAMVRYNSDGSLDTTFSGDGKVTTAIGTGSDVGYSVAVQADGKILVVGSSYGSNSDFAVVCYNSDGSLDTTFSNDGKLTTVIDDVTFVENGAPVVLMHISGVIRDTELSTLNNYNGSTLILERNGSADSQDQFSGSGIVAGQGIGEVTASGMVVGSYAYTNGSLVISFNSNATQALVNKVVQNIAYSNTSDTPPAGVQIKWTFNDGNTGSQGTGGVLTATGYTNVDIVSVNDAPVVFAPVALNSVTEDGEIILITQAQLLANSTDIDGDTLSVINLSASAGTLVNNQNGTWSLTPVANYNGTITLNYDISDGTTSVAATATQEVTAVNDQLIGTIEINGHAVEGQTLNAANSFADADGLGSISYQWLANGMAITNATQPLYTLTANEIGKTITVEASYTDLGGTLESKVSLATASVIQTYFNGTVGADTLTGNASANVLDGKENADNMIGGLGDDTYYVDNLKDIVIEATNSGNDTVIITMDTGYTGKFTNIETVYGSTGNDTVTLGTAQISGMIDLGVGTDKLTLALGTNTLRVMNVESIIGNTGADNIVLGTFLTSSNTINLGSGTDKLTLSDGTNTATLKYIETIIGGSGADTITLATAQKVGTIDLGNDTDTLILANGTNKLTVSNVEMIIGSTGADTITITSESAVATTINAGSGNDVLTGGIGNDTLNGGYGNDKLTGGIGNDIFVFNTALSSSYNRDTIIDFTSGEDKIHLENSIFTNLITSGILSENNFIANSTGKAVDSNDYIVYNTTSGVLSYDANGSGFGAGIQIALIGSTVHPTLSAIDFTVI
ncbi:cadherin-like domain-containing protein [Sulfuricurvum sp.]|uniref:cadherin-like domain-containing protein n=1 Tax=Sulfuricurvum sp. TaxID=2025608 RepID=UPI00261D3A64|nr:cadherin-like domain-containing protein [Sulfuricurvum sp.]MDD2780799.1 cadherin-like domain-containing protein [Sulfuricurvum sp.]